MMNVKRLLVKTLIDVLIAGMISIGIFQSPTFIIQNIFAYVPLIGIVIIIVILMRIYAGEEGTDESIFRLSIAIVVSIIEVFIIGLSLGKEIELIIVVWFITLPSVIVFDNLMK